jgi:ArsR family transcriptional regulator
MPELRSPFRGAFGRADAERLATALKALADPGRLRILGNLWHAGEASQIEITRALGSLSQPTVSHHMSILADAGFVSRRSTPGGPTRYTLTPVGVIAVAGAVSPDVVR